MERRRTGRRTRKGLALAIGGTVLFCAALATLLTGPAAGSGPNPGGVVETILPSASPDSFLVLVPSREEGEIRLDLEEARAAELAAGELFLSARETLARAKAQIDVKKSEIQTIKSREKLAKEQDLDAEKKEHERKRKAEERNLKLLEARREMRDAEKDFAEALKTSVRARVRLHDRELQILNLRVERSALGASSQAASFIDQITRFDGDIRKTERGILDAMKELAEKLETVAKREAELLDRRLKVMDAQEKILEKRRG